MREHRARIPHCILAAALFTLGASLAPDIASADAAVTGTMDRDTHPTAGDLCAHCKVLVGIGATYQLWGWSDGLVLPVTFEFADSRWELGAFRMARTQLITGRSQDVPAAQPYWGFSAMRRWQLLHRPWGRLYFGFGASYKTEIDYLNSTRLNFSYLLGIRFAPGDHAALLEVGIRHWSNFWIRQPNRGQDFVTVTASF